MNEQKQYVRPVTDEAVLKVTKEIIVKFIEIGRVTPGNFEEHYAKVFSTIKHSAKELADDSIS